MEQKEKNKPINLTDALVKDLKTSTVYLLVFATGKASCLLVIKLKI